MDIERSQAMITSGDLRELAAGSRGRLFQHFGAGEGRKWLHLYDIKSPLAVALCQGSAMHFYDSVNGVKDFDIWFFYPFNERHLPYRTIWTWDYRNPKFGRHPSIAGYSGRKVDVIVRSIRNYELGNPVQTIYKFLENERTESSKLLALKAVVLLEPSTHFSQVIWYKGRLGIVEYR
jgi:hypothetical protein